MTALVRVLVPSAEPVCEPRTEEATPSTVSASGPACAMDGVVVSGTRSEGDASSSALTASAARIAIRNSAAD